MLSRSTFRVIKRLESDEMGSAVVEYAVLLSVVAAAAVSGLAYVGSSLKDLTFGLASSLPVASLAYSDQVESKRARVADCEANRPGSRIDALLTAARKANSQSNPESPVGPAGSCTSR